MNIEAHPYNDRIIILGGGIAGLTAARHYADTGASVVLLEAQDHLGGAHSSRDIGPYTFDLGSIFYEDTAKLFDLAPGIRTLCTPAKRIQRRITPDGQVYHYPIEPKDLLRWPRLRLAQAVCAMLWARVSRARDGTLNGACLARLGPVFFQETGLRNYTLHFNGVPPEQIGEAFYDERMKFVHHATKLGRAVRSAWRSLRGKAFRKTPRARLRIRPRVGYHVLFDQIAADLREHRVEIVTSAEVQRITGAPGPMQVVTSKGTFIGDQVIGAMALEGLHQACTGCPSGLKTLDLLSLFVSAESVSTEAGTVLFNFHAEGGWKRATFYSRLYPDPSIDREFFTVEITVPPEKTQDPETAFERLRAHWTTLGLARDMRLEGAHLSPGAYPLLLPGQGGKVQEALDRVTAAGVLPVGRQGRFEYLPTAGGVITRTRQEIEQKQHTVPKRV